MKCRNCYAKPALPRTPFCYPCLRLAEFVFPGRNRV